MGAPEPWLCVAHTQVMSLLFGLCALFFWDGRHLPATYPQQGLTQSVGLSHTHIHTCPLASVPM